MGLFVHPNMKTLLFTFKLQEAVAAYGGDWGTSPPPGKPRGRTPWMEICRNVPPLKKFQVNYLLSLNS